MSAQGATLGRGTVHIPIWPVAVVVLAAATVAAGIGLTSTDTIAPARPLVVTDIQRLANSTAAVREQGAVIPVAVGISHVTPSAVGFAGFENPGAYATQLPAFAGFENPGAYATQLPAYAGFENPGAYGISQVTEATQPVGLENPGAYAEASDSDFTPTMGPRPGMTGAKICGQCR
jgi:hypothetical protein